MSKLAPALCLALLLPGLAACKPAGTVAAGQAGVKESASPAAKKQGGKLARIVFVDQEKSCACTKKRIDASWKALMTVLGFPPTIALDRYHLDTQDKQAEPFLAKKPIVAAPGIYLLDQSGGLLELLQGEVTEAQLRATLARL